MSAQPHLFCFGLGHSALTLAKQLLPQGWRVSGTCRSLEKCESLRPLGITAHLFDQDLPLQVTHDLLNATHILHSIPPSDHGDVVMQLHGQDISNCYDLQWFGYFSTTGVYGDHKGEWVTETSECKPVNDRSSLRVEAEQTWLQALPHTHIFRLSGIYGPKRSTFHALDKGTARRVDKPGQVFSRIHVDDIAAIVKASIDTPSPGSIYNCADDLPAPQSDVVAYAAELAGVEVPPLVPFDQAELSPMARSFYSANRKVANNKIKDELGVTLKFPTYKEGLQDCLKRKSG